MKTFGTSKRGALLVLGITLVGLASACEDDERIDFGPPSTELLDGCTAYLTKLDGISETNGCTRIDPASDCELLHDDNRCEAEYEAVYACLAAAATAEDCQCEMCDGGPLCNEAEASCDVENDALLDCINSNAGR